MRRRRLRKLIKRLRELQRQDLTHPPVGEVGLNTDFSQPIDFAGNSVPDRLRQDCKGSASSSKCPRPFFDDVSHIRIGIAGLYLAHEYAAEKRIALGVWASCLDVIVDRFRGVRDLRAGEGEVVVTRARRSLRLASTSGCKRRGGVRADAAASLARGRLTFKGGRRIVAARLLPVGRSDSRL